MSFHWFVFNGRAAKDGKKQAARAGALQSGRQRSEVRGPSVVVYCIEEGVFRRRVSPLLNKKRAIVSGELLELE